MIAVDAITTLDRLSALIADLSEGFPVEFGQSDEGPLAFTIIKAGGSYVMRTPQGQEIARASTFAEVWRARPSEAA